ncbi:MAG: hypothetical protein FJ088_12645, partial [Deltaproteobacteria bacterium]|nr:hypothetical protein [Deltaproteobacteria bacterium]
MKKTGILLILPASAVLLIYAQTLEFDFVNWDDNLYVTENRGVSSPEEAGIRELMLTSYLGYPVPLTILSYRLDYLFNGLDPFYFHLANLIIFIAIVYLLMSLMISTGSGFVPSLLASLLFAAHPLAVEPVAWVSGRKDLLSLLFALASLAFFFKAAGFLKTERNRRKSGLFLILSGVSFALSLVSKPVFVLLPLIFAVKTDEFVPAGRTKGVLALILSCLVFAAGVITAGMIFQKDVGALSDPK